MRYILESALIIIVFILALLCFDLNGELTELKPENRELRDITLMDMTLNLLEDDFKNFYIRGSSNVNYVNIPRYSNDLAVKILISLGVSNDSSFQKNEKLSKTDYLKKCKEFYHWNNVRDLQYQLFYCSSFKNPYIPLNFICRPESDTYIPGSTVKDEYGLEWEFIESRRITLDTAEAYDYINKNLSLPENFIPKYPLEKQVMIGNKSDSLLYYSTKYDELIKFEKRKELGERIFVLNFKLPKWPGWYLIHFTSKSNRILAIINESDYLDKKHFHIGNVKVRVKDVEFICEHLYKKLKKYNVPDYTEYNDSIINYKHYHQISTAKYKAKTNPEDVYLINIYSNLLEYYQNQNLYHVEHFLSGRLRNYYISVNFAE